ncbi:hypothetical protein Q7F05_19775 [Pseudomonas sp. Lb2C1-1]
MFITADKVTAGFSRYLWVREMNLKPEAAPETPATEEPAPAEPVSE